VAIDLYLKGELPFGEAESLGLAENAVGLTDNQWFQALATEEMKATLADLRDKILSGEIQVGTAFGMSTEELEALRESVRP